MFAMMIDVACEKCGRRIGWRGRMADRPACPRCEYRPAQAELEAADAKIQEMQRLLSSRPVAEYCRRQRVAAGLTLRQAAIRLGLTGTELSDYEEGCRALPDALAQQMGALYGCGEQPPG